jgi:multiple sugar transport system permease protein
MTLSGPRQPIDPAQDIADSAKARQSSSISSRMRLHVLEPYLFVLPQITLFSLFVIFPLSYAVYLGFQSWDLFSSPHFVGARNYVRLVHDPVFRYAFRNTMWYVAATVPSCIGLGLILALGLNRQVPLRSLLRGIYFLPVVVSAVVTALAGTWVFNDNFGLLNRLLSGLDLPRVHWLSNPKWAMTSLVVTTIWLRAGFCMIIYLAALQSIPKMLYEAACMDGAGSISRFVHVTWPSLRPATVFLTVMNVIYSFHVFDLIFVMTGGGPGYSTIVLVQYIYNLAFQASDMGYASAVGTALFAILLVFSLLQWRLSRRGEISS